jgi:hypothetical protein
MQQSPKLPSQDTRGSNPLWRIMTYLIVYKQKGEGCDYTIGCGIRIERIVANNLDEVSDHLRKTFDPNEPKMDKDDIESIDVHQVIETTSVDPEEIGTLFQ